jgi:RNA recognition motif-containing protein
LSKTCPSKSLRKKCTISSAVSDPSDRSDCNIPFFKTNDVRGNKNATRGTAYVVYESPGDAKVAVEKLNGFSFGGRFLVVLMHQLDKVVKPEDLVTRQEELERLKKQYNVA